MSRFSPLLFVLMVGTALLAQSVESRAAQDEAYASITLVKYCANVETLTGSLTPRMFAQVSFGPGLASGWAEFDDVAAWRRAGRPEPLALVWYKESNPIRVVLSSGSGKGTTVCRFLLPSGWQPGPVSLRASCTNQVRPVPVALRCEISRRVTVISPEGGSVQMQFAHAIAGARRHGSSGSIWVTSHSQRLSCSPNVKTASLPRWTGQSIWGLGPSSSRWDTYPRNRQSDPQCESGGIGRRTRLRIWRVKPWGFESLPFRT